MSKKIIVTLCIVIGLTSLLLMFIDFRNLPAIEEAVLNEVSLTVIVNNHKAKGIKRRIERIREQFPTHYGPDLTHQHADPPRIRQTKELITKTSHFVDSISTWFDRVVANAEDSLPANPLEIDQIKNSDNADKQLIQQVKPYIKSIYQIPESDSYNLKVLQIENIRAQVYDGLQVFLDSVAAQHEAASIKFGGMPDQIPGAVKGLISFNPPTTMELEQKYRVQVKITKELRADLMKEMAVGEATIDSLLVGDIMIVRLMGDDFTITPLEEEEQGVLDDGYSQWEFDVTPLNTGDHKLFIKAGIMYHVPNLGPTKKFFPVFEKEVKIKVSHMKRLGNFVTQRWDFLISSFVIPLLMWGYTEVRKRRRATTRKNMRPSNTESNNTTHH